jgi:hypothetical protein
MDQSITLPRGCTNNRNTLTRIGTYVIKHGPALDEEIYFYKTIHHPLFPVFYESTPTSLTIHYIEGPTVSKLFRTKLLQRDTLEAILSGIRLLHSEPAHDIPTPTSDMIYDNIMGNLDRHYANAPAIYDALPHAGKIVEHLRKILRDYVNSPELRIVNVVHGDLWFENILLTTSNEVKLIDMRGKAGALRTVKGDPNLDFAKLYQSVLGFDYALYDESYDPEYEDTICQWMREMSIPIDSPAVQSMTAACILKSFFYFSDSSKIYPTYRLLWKLPVVRNNFPIPAVLGP